MARQMRMAEERYAEILKRNSGQDVPPIGAPGHQAPQTTKYRSKKVVAHGKTFDSQLEAKEYGKLLERQQCGQIRNLRTQVKFSLFAPGGYHLGTYTSDFEYEEYFGLTEDHRLVFGENRWIRVVADAKSEYTRKMRGWNRTKALMYACHGIAIKELP